MHIKRLINLTCCCVLAAATATSLSSCKKEQNELAHHHNHEHSAGHEHGADEVHEHEHDAHTAHQEGSPEKEAGNHGEIVLEHDRAEKLGVKATAIVPGEFYETVTVGGELTPAPSDRSTVAARSAGIVHLSPSATPGAHLAKGAAIATVSAKGMAGGDATEASAVALKAAKRELDRLTPLHADGIVSTRDYNAALQAYESAKAAAGATGNGTGTAATAPASGTITELLVAEGQYVDAGTPIAVISGSNTLSLKANLPERNVGFLSKISGAKFRTSYSSEIHDIADFNGHRSSGAQSAVATGGYIPVYFTLTNNGTLAAGSFCEVYLAGNRREGVMSIPSSALSEQQGEHFVYIRLDDDCYEKRPVKLGATSGDAVEILSGIAEGENVVTEGAIFVRLAESSGVVPEGHSHNH